MAFLTDSSSNNLTFTANGDAAASSAQVKFGTTAMAVTRTGSGWLKAAYFAGAPWLFTTGNFTFDFWVYHTDASYTNFEIYGGIGRDTNHRAIIFGRRATTGVLSLWWATNLTTWEKNAIDFNATAITGNTWHHIAIVRSGNTIHGYLDGTELGTGQALTQTTLQTDTSSDLNITSNELDAGTYSDGLIGYMDEYRLSNNARWTANFTPPTLAYTSDANTVALLHLDSPATGVNHLFNLMGVGM